MTLSRRAFLGAAASAAAAARQARAVHAAPATDQPDWAWVRAQFDLAPDWMHFSSFFLASHPRPVREEIERIRQAIDRDPFAFVEHGLFERPRAVREAAARYLGGQAEEVALTRSTTEGLALVYAGLPLAAGDEVLTTTHEHYSHHEAIRLAAGRAGAGVQKVSLYDDARTATAAGMVERLRRAIRPATRVVGITWVHSSTGVKTPVRAIADALALANHGRTEAERVLLIVDGAHGLGVEDADVAALGCDFFCAGTHKWMLGPRGTGIVWGRESVWPRLRPTIPAFEIGSFAAWAEGRDPGPTRAAAMSPGGFQAFEHLWALPAAFQLHQRIGRPRIAARLRRLNARLNAGLSDIRGVTVHTPPGADVAAALVCFDVAGVKPEEVVRRLHARRIVASAAPYPVSYARLAASLVNTPTEVEAAIGAVAAIARL
ncbi:MAG: aminotransferase class V-fold PLP-dependent enzyme [Vicinamibacteria bacterium]